MPNPTLSEIATPVILSAAVVLGLAVACIPIAVLILHGQSIELAVYAGLRALWAYLIVCAAMLAAAAAAVLIASARGRGRLGR